MTQRLRHKRTFGSITRTIITLLLLLFQLSLYSQDWRYVKGKKVYRDFEEASKHPIDVYNLELYGRDVIATKLSVIAEMRNLQFLTISTAGLDSLPESIFTLPNVRTLNLTKNRFSNIPEGIKQIKSLEYLVMYDNEIREVPDWIGSLTNLETLILPRNKIGYVSPAIGKLGKLVDLSLDGNEITDLPAEMGQLRSLRTLSLGENQITRLPDEITNLYKLESLSISYNKLTALPASIGHLTRLEYLHASNNSITALTPSISSLKRLKSLTLQDNPLDSTIEGFTFTTNLEHLTLSGKSIRSIPPSLQFAKKLSHIVITNTSVTTVPGWLNDLKELDWLNLGSNHITTIPNLPKLQKLRILTLATNSLDTMPGSIFRLPHLKTVDVSENPMKHIPQEIAASKSLQYFNIQKTSIPNEEYRSFRRRLRKQLDIPHDKIVYFENEDGPCYTELPNVNKLPILTKLQHDPYFMGGTEAWKAFFTNNFRSGNIHSLPEANPALSDSVTVEFIVRKEGGISNLQAITGLYQSTKDEAIRLLKLSCPYWVPSNYGGRNMHAWYRQIFLFEFKEDGGVEIKVKN